jgi:hypothetical protein
MARSMTRNPVKVAARLRAAQAAARQRQKEADIGVHPKYRNQRSFHAPQTAAWEAASRKWENAHG